jgi:DNA polymerase-1
MEVRVFMFHFRNKQIDEILNKDDVDFHSEAAKLAFSVDESSEKFKEYRQAAKAITFGTIYGIGNKKLSQQLNTTPREAGQYKKQYFAAMEGSKEFFDKAVNKVALDGQIRSKYGRLYKINRDFGYKGVNYLVQGLSADLLSERMLEVDKYLDNKKSNLLLQVHDEIICEIHDSELESVPYKIKELLKNNSLEIPLDVDMEIFQGSWAIKKDLKPLTFDDLIDWN